MADNNPIASRGGNVVTRLLFGAGFPDLEDVVDELKKRVARSAVSQ